MKFYYLLILPLIISCTNNANEQLSPTVIEAEINDTINTDFFDYNDESTVFWEIHNDSSNYRISASIDSMTNDGYYTYAFSMSTKGIVLSKEKDQNPHITPTPIVRYIMPDEYNFSDIEKLIDFDAYLNMTEPKHSANSSNIISSGSYVIINTTGQEIRHFHEIGEEPDAIKPLLDFIWNIVKKHPAWEELKHKKINTLK